MADLPKIESLSPVVTPAITIEEKTYPDRFMMALNVETNPQDMNCRAVVRLLPYNYTTKELLLQEGVMKRFIIEDLWTEAARVPLLAQMMGGIIQVVDLLVKEKDLTEAIAVATGEAKTTLEGQLTTVQTALGVS